MVLNMALNYQPGSFAVGVWLFFLGFELVASNMVSKRYNC